MARDQLLMQVEHVLHQLRVSLAMCCKLLRRHLRRLPQFLLILEMSLRIADQAVEDIGRSRSEWFRLHAFKKIVCYLNQLLVLLVDVGNLDTEQRRPADIGLGILYKICDYPFKSNPVMLLKSFIFSSIRTAS